MTIAIDRLQIEILEREKSERILRSIVEGTVAVTGVDFCRSLVRSLAQALDVRYAFITERNRAILEIFAARAAAEMERL